MADTVEKGASEPSAETPKAPTHVAIIMDGNGRWAKARGLPRLRGHQQGVETVREIINTARDRGVKYLTLYTFSVDAFREAGRH